MKQIFFSDIKNVIYKKLGRDIWYTDSQIGEQIEANPALEQSLYIKQGDVLFTVKLNCKTIEIRSPYSGYVDYNPYDLRYHRT